jgi:hypothetical protein
MELNGMEGLIDEHRDDGDKHPRKDIELVRIESEVVGHFGDYGILILSNESMNPLGQIHI